jgi:hypothetical protein
MPPVTPVAPAEPAVVPPVAPVVTPAVIQAATDAVIAQVKPVVQAAVVSQTNAIVAEFERTQLGKAAVKFFDSAVGKSVEILLWTLGAYLVTIVGAFVANVHLAPDLAALGIPGLLNWAAYTAKVFIDAKVPNLPTA